MAVLTPSIHCEAYSADDNRYDLRPILYETNWHYQFNKIDEVITEKTRRKSDIGKSENKIEIK